MSLSDDELADLAERGVYPEDDLAHLVADYVENGDITDTEPECDITQHPALAFVRLKYQGRPYVLVILPGTDPPYIHGLRRAAQSVVSAVRNAGPAPGHHRAVLERTRNDWPVLMRAIDQLDRAIARYTKDHTT